MADPLGPGGEAPNTPRPTVRGILDLAMVAHGLLGVVYGATALTHPAMLEPLHTTPPPEDAHLFRAHGIALLIVGLIALYVASFVRDRVHTYWIGAVLWFWSGITTYTTYYDHVMGGRSTMNLVWVLGSILALYTLAFLMVSLLPGAPVTEHVPSHKAHHDRQAAAGKRRN